MTSRTRLWRGVRPPAPRRGSDRTCPDSDRSPPGASVVVAVFRAALAKAGDWTPPVASPDTGFPSRRITRTRRTVARFERLRQTHVRVNLVDSAAEHSTGVVFNRTGIR